MKSIIRIPLQLLMIIMLATGAVRADFAVVNINELRLAENQILVSDVLMGVSKFTIVQYKGDAEEIRRPLTLLAEGQEVEISYSGDKSELRMISKIVILSK